MVVRCWRMVLFMVLREEKSVERKKEKEKQYRGVEPGSSAWRWWYDRGLQLGFMSGRGMRTEMGFKCAYAQSSPKNAL